MVESRIVIPVVVGSSPISHPTEYIEKSKSYTLRLVALFSLWRLIPLPVPAQYPTLINAALQSQYADRLGAVALARCCAWMALAWVAGCWLLQVRLLTGSPPYRARLSLNVGVTSVLPRCLCRILTLTAPPTRNPPLPLPYRSAWGSMASRMTGDKNNCGYFFWYFFKL